MPQVTLLVLLFFLFCAGQLLQLRRIIAHWSLEVRPGRIKKKLESISLISDSSSQMVFSVLLRYSDNDRRDLVLFQFYATVDCRIFYPLHL